MGRYEDLIRRGLYQYDKEALFELGEMYRDGVGVKQDLEEAERWFSKAKQLGHLKAERAIAALQTALPEPEPKDQPFLFVEDESKESPATKEEQSGEHPYCPRGHGQVRSWSGGMRCWTCGWTPEEGAIHIRVEKPEEEEAKSYSMGGCCGVIVGLFFLLKACEEFL